VQFLVGNKLLLKFYLWIRGCCMNGVRHSILRVGIIFLTICAAQAFAETDPQKHVEKPGETTPDASARRAAEVGTATEKQKTLAEKIAKDRKELIDALAKATTPEAKEIAAVALRKSLGDDVDGKTLKPQTLSDLVEALKKADATADKETAVKNLMKALSYSGEGEDLTPKILHDQVEKLKKAVGKEAREEAAKAVLKAMGPDGVNHFKLKDGKIDMVALANALDLDETKDKDGRTSLTEEQEKAKKELQIALSKPAPPEVSKNAVDLGGGTPALGGNPVDQNTGKAIDNGQNVDVSNIDQLGANGNDNVADVGLGNNQVDDLADVNQNEIDRLNELRDLQDRLNDAERDRDLARNQGDRVSGDRVNSKTENPEQPIQPPQISAGSGGGSPGGGGEPPPPPTPPVVPTFPPFTPPPIQQAGNDNGLLGEILKLSQGKTGENSGEWMAKMTADLLGMNQQNMATLLSTLTTIGGTMAKNIAPVQAGLAVTRSVGNVYGGAMPNLYGKDQRLAKNAGPRSQGGPRSQARLSKAGKRKAPTIQVASTSSSSASGELRKPLRGAKRSTTARAIRK